MLQIHLGKHSWENILGKTNSTTKASVMEQRLLTLSKSRIPRIPYESRI